jgi:hypothetical protein
VPESSISRGNAIPHLDVSRSIPRFVVRRQNEDGDPARPTEQWRRDDK